MSTKLLKNESGFTLIELMVVVAIIGVLSAIAVPNFKKYQAKAKQSEAKIQLAAVYSSEVNSLGDFNEYATCISTLGYDTPSKGYYVVGFDKKVVSPTMTTANPTCGASTVFAVAPLNPSKSGGAAPTAVTAANGITATTFLAGAEGNVSAALIDKWTIDQNKNIVNSAVGY